MLQIHLKNLRFFSFHGMYPEERKCGNHFEVNIDIQCAAPSELPIKKIGDSIDYVGVYELVSERMKIPTPLLETLATEIAQAVLERFALAEEISISIDKLSPPIVQFEGKVGVSFTLKRGKDV